MHPVSSGVNQSNEIPRIQPGIYPISVTDNAIKFRIRKKEFTIEEIHLMNSPDAAIGCLTDHSPRGRIFPLKLKQGNRFTIGKYGEIEISVHFNHVEIRRSMNNTRFERDQNQAII